jgi:hypothetical protein
LQEEMLPRQTSPCHFNYDTAKCLVCKSILHLLWGEPSLLYKLYTIEKGHFGLAAMQRDIGLREITSPCEPRPDRRAIWYTEDGDVAVLCQGAEKFILAACPRSNDSRESFDASRK